MPVQDTKIERKGGGVVVCAKLVTENRKGQQEVLLLSVARPLVIGRNKDTCAYAVSDPVVSSIHCKIYAVQSSHGGVIVSCQDLSSNGLFLNGHWIHGTSAILMNGDILQLPSSQKFKCVHLSQDTAEKPNLFSPPSYVAQSLGRWLVTSHSLGSGSFATVRLAMDTSEHAHRQVACKTLKRKKGDRNAVMKEAQILGSLSHPNINRVYDVVSDNKHIHIFLELCTGGDLFSYIAHYEETAYRLCEGEAQYIMYQLLQGLEYLHERLISHRDLKPENILLHSPGPYPRIQIADFGLARPKSYQETFNVCGTVPYLPPEGILALDNKSMGYIGIPADCWSAGVVMYLMLAGQHPFDYGVCPGDPDWPSSIVLQSHDRESQFWLSSERNDNIVKKRIIEGDVEFPEEIWGTLPEARTLCGWLLSPDPQTRATVFDAQNSEWIKCDLAELTTAYRKRINSR